MHFVEKAVMPDPVEGLLYIKEDRGSVFILVEVVADHIH